MLLFKNKNSDLTTVKFIVQYFFFVFFVLTSAEVSVTTKNLNPIELIWAGLKNDISCKFCSTWPEINNTIGKYRDSLTPEECARFIDTLIEVIKNKINELPFKLI